MKKALTSAALLLAALPGYASAHSVTIQCDATQPGRYVVTPDFLNLSPVTTFGPSGITVVWSDRYTRSLSYPTGCIALAPPPAPPPAAPPAPPPVPPALLEAAPAAAPAPPVVPLGPGPGPGVERQTPPRKRAYRCAKGKLPSYASSLVVFRRHHAWCSYRVPRKPYHPPVAG